MNPLRKLVEGLWRIDLRLVVLAMRVSHAIDYRYHRNQFQQGAMVLTLAICMEVANAAIMILRDWRISWLIVVAMAISSATIIFVYADLLRRMERASADLERDPARPTYTIAVFIIGCRPLRFMLVFLGSFIAAASLLPWVFGSHSFLFTVEMVCNGWEVVAGVALYLAGGIPPTRKRKAKKEKAQPLLAAAPNQA